MHIHIKGVSVRFGFDAIRISQVQTVSQEQSNGDVLCDVVYMSLCAYMRVCDNYMYIGVGLSALLVSTYRALREPL